MLFGIIIGIMLWQLVCTIITVVTNEKEDIIIPAACGIFSLFMYCIGLVYRSIRLMISRKYNCYQIYGHPKDVFDDPCHWWVMNVYMTPKVATQFRTVDEYGYNYAIKLLRAGKEFHSAPYRNEIVKLGDIFPGMSEEFFKKFLKNN